MELILIAQHFYTSNPIENYDEDRCRYINRKAVQAPIITLYGRMRDGTRAALHIHGYYPFFYVQLPKDFEPNFEEMTEILEKEINSGKKQGIPIIHDMQIVEKIPFYGFHTEKVRFIKISVYSTENVKKVAEICCDGICGIRLQPYEAHIDVFQQLYTDYNFAGMEWIKSKKAFFRQPCILPSAPTHNINKSTYCEIEADCMHYDLERSEVAPPHNFGQISMPSILGIWFKEFERRMKSNESMHERISKLPENYNFTYDFIQSPEHKHQLLYLKSLPKDNLDILSANPPTNYATVNMVDEDDYKLLDDIIDTSKPNLIENKINAEMMKLDYISPAQTYHEKRLKDFTERMTSARVRKFFFSQNYNENLNFSIGFAYEYSPQPPKYEDVLESSQYSVRIVNQPLFLGTKNKIIIQGITNPEILSNENYKNLPDFAHKLAKNQIKADPFQNSYLYKPIPPKYNDIFQLSQSESSLTNSQAINLQPVKAYVPTPPQKSHNSYVTTFFLEIFCETRGSLLPDPKIDPIRFIVYKVHDDLNRAEEGLIQFGHKSSCYIRSKYSFNVTYVNTEKLLIEWITLKIQKSDPDFIIGFETERASIGYLMKRAKAIKYDMPSQISRLFKFSAFNPGKIGGQKIPGRMILTAWRIVKAEENYYSYNFHNLVYLVLNVRLPYYSSETLTRFFAENRYLVYDYIWDILVHTEKLIDHYTIIERNVLLAQVYCMDLPSVFTRGSQYRVEALMKKIIKSSDYLLLSAMKSQIQSQKELEIIPLVVEPEKKFWVDPVIVLDFQSLYPSLMIAYNLCYCTCLGKLNAQPYKKFGVTTMKGSIYSGENDILIAPNNVGYINWTRRRGILPRMMYELLQTRIMIKNAMKKVDKKSIEYVQLFSQQLGIKLLCNTTYGYTGAGQSGRMPCNDIADTIVALGRKTLEAAIYLVENNPKWDAKVIYGDTDSMMIKLGGRTVEQAFQVGKEIANAINQSNPKPVEILLEKVYCPMITLAKKHYTGWKYEKPDSVPVFEAKGIETVRRDNCPLSATILQKALTVLFSKDVSQLYDFLCNEWNQILTGKARIIDFIFHEKVSLDAYKNPPPAYIISKRKEDQDRMAKPLWGERIGYVVISGKPGDNLSDQVVSPEDFLANPDYQLNSSYYIERNLNTILNRLLETAGIDVFAWYQKYPKRRGNTQLLNNKPLAKSGSARLDRYYQPAHCIICKCISQTDFCESCGNDTQKLNLGIQIVLKQEEKKLKNLDDICRACTGCVRDIECISLDCPIYLEKNKIKREFEGKLLKMHKKLK
ncbi:REV3 [Blepharisma stoltei]|uniref:DNA polymerase n=1 Tax=Blepharisma stoltei TaxID=1481888 RepID=A0AAU9JGD7_9CILI|nr:unnamed protein product [Blepharisma stoltei]